MKIEKGVMIVKNGKGWGVTYKDGHCTSYGWVCLENADIHDERFCKKPTDVTYNGSPYSAELFGGEVVKAIRTTTVEILRD